MQNYTTAESPAAALGTVAHRGAAQTQTISRPVYSWLTRCLEMGLMVGAGLAAAAAVVEPGAGQTTVHVVASVGAALVASSLFSVTGLYTLPAMQRLTEQLPRLLGGWSIAMAVLLAAIGLISSTGGHDVILLPLWLKVWFTAGAAALVLGRLAHSLVTRRLLAQGRLTRRAVVYGSGKPCQDLLKSLAADAGSDIRICGIYDDRGTSRGSGQVAYPNHGRLDNLIGFARSSNVDLVILALPISAELRLIELLSRLWVLPADIRLAASASQLRLAPRAYSHAGGIELMALADKPISDWGQIAKSAFDRIIGLAALIALSPVMLATAIAIKLDSRGPVLFRQKRYGFNNELIEVFKFRSMYTNAADQAAAKLVTKDDPRVTRVGRFIRKTSLDELPQLFNVLIGNLSLVGPRPHAVSAKAGDKLYGDAFDGYFARHKVKPGITGWAQINGWRGETDTEDKLRHRVEHDLWYIEHWSILLDAIILVRTPFALLNADNAY